MTVAAVPTTTDIRVRPATFDELSHFVYETALKVRRPRGVPWSEWETSVGNRMTEVLAAPASRVNVGEWRHALVGFAHFLDDVLHMLYVKRELRGLGYGLELLQLDALGMNGGVLKVHAPNVVWRRWAYKKNVRWIEA